MRAACLAVLLAGCVAVTINVSFPQEKLDSAASSIEDLVGGGGAPAKPEPPKPAPKPDTRSMVPASGWTVWLLPDPAEAQAIPELKTRTPEVMASIASRRRRLPQLEDALRKGCLGENAQGFVEARPGQDCPADLSQLVAAENGDRSFLYTTLVEQNHMPPADVSRVQAAFGKVHREKAAPGTWVQAEDGQWTRR